jgi:hypothetical protein
MRTHFEAWVEMWRDIGKAHVLGHLIVHRALLKAHRDSLVFGNAYVMVKP